MSRRATPRLFAAFIQLVLFAASGGVLAQTAPAAEGVAATNAPIERVKLTDGDATCRALFDESKAMDTAISLAKEAQAGGQTTKTAGQAAGVAAEVANRTGVFGALGGLTGQLFGGIASKTAAGVAEQSGQQSAAQAAEREKQALARKEYVSELFIAKGCSARDPSAPAKNPTATPPRSGAASAGGAAVTSTKEVSAEVLSGARHTALSLKLDVINPEDLLDSNKTLVIPTAYITLITDGRVAGSKQSGMFQAGHASAHASASYRVEGLDKAYAQQLAKAAYDNLIAQLRQAGYTVLSFADVKDRDPVRSAARASSPLASSEGGNNLMTVAPTDEQHFASGFAGGVFSEFITGGKTKFTDATLIIPHYTFHAPQAWAESSRGYKSVSVSASVVHGMNMTQARVTWMGQPRSRMMRGIPGVATREQVINVTEKAGHLSTGVDTSPQAANALGSALTMLTGAGNIQRSATSYVFTIDREAFAAGVMNGVHNFNAEVASAAANAKP